MSRKILVVDLDGTLLKVNTFHHWLKHLLANQLENFRIMDILLVFCLIGARAIKLISHTTLKFYVLKLSLRMKPESFSAFAERLYDTKNGLEEYLEDDTYSLKVLATAAPNCYAHHIASAFNFDVCLATENPIGRRSLWKENIRENKLNAVKLVLKQHGLEQVDLLLTDHKDDYPLMKISKKILLVNPMESTLQFLKDKKVDFKIFNNGTKK